MNGPDGLPATLPNKQFPIGDVIDTQKEERVKAWFRKTGSYDNNSFSEYVESTYYVSPIEVAEIRANHDAAHGLCQVWDRVQGDNRRFAVTGFIIARSFMNDTQLLPKFTNDLTDAIERMREPGMTGRTREFARAAWSGMQYSHPRVHAHFDRLLERAKSVYELESAEYREYCMAGMALPYMMSATSRLIGYTGNFAGMTQNKYNLQTTPFRKFFTIDHDLAPGDPQKRVNRQSAEPESDTSA